MTTRLYSAAALMKVMVQQRSGLVITRNRSYFTEWKLTQSTSMDNDR